MSLRNSLIMKKYMFSRDSSDEIIINDRPYGLTDKLKKRLKIKDIIVYIEIIILALIFKGIYDQGLGFRNRFLNIGLFFIVSLFLVYLTSRIIISKKLVDNELVPINRMYR